MGTLDCTAGVFVGLDVEILQKNLAFKHGIVKKADTEQNCNLVVYEDGQKEWIDLTQNTIKLYRFPQFDAGQKQAQHPSWYQDPNATIEVYGSFHELKYTGSLLSTDDDGNVSFMTSSGSQCSFNRLTEYHKIVFRNGWPIPSQHSVQELIQCHVEILSEVGVLLQGKVCNCSDDHQICVVNSLTKEQEWIDIGSYGFKIEYCVGEQEKVETSGIETTALPFWYCQRGVQVELYDENHQFVQSMALSHVTDDKTLHLVDNDQEKTYHIDSQSHKVVFPRGWAIDGTLSPLRGSVIDVIDDQMQILMTGRVDDMAPNNPTQVCLFLHDETTDWIDLKHVGFKVHCFMSDDERLNHVSLEVYDENFKLVEEVQKFRVDGDVLYLDRLDGSCVTHNRLHVPHKIVCKTGWSFEDPQLSLIGNKVEVYGPEEQITHIGHVIECRLTPNPSLHLQYDDDQMDWVDVSSRMFKICLNWRDKAVVKREMKIPELEIGQRIEYTDLTTGKIVKGKVSLAKGHPVYTVSSDGTSNVDVNISENKCKIHLQATDELNNTVGHRVDIYYRHTQSVAHGIVHQVNRKDGTILVVLKTNNKVWVDVSKIKVKLRLGRGNRRGSVSMYEDPATGLDSISETPVETADVSKVRQIPPDAAGSPARVLFRIYSREKLKESSPSIVTTGTKAQSFYTTSPKHEPPQLKKSGSVTMGEVLDDEWADLSGVEEVNETQRTNTWMSTDIDDPSLDIRWYEKTDPSSNEKYWVCAKTNESQWTPPKWLDGLDPHSGHTYYSNTATGETQWDCPEDFEPIHRITASSLTSPPVGPMQAIRQNRRRKS